MHLDQNHIAQIKVLCQTHHVSELALFGSALNERFHPESDIDFLVSFLPEIDLLEYADNYFSLLDKLENITQRKVDLLSKKSLKNPILIEEIKNSKITLYDNKELQISS